MRDALWPDDEHRWHAAEVEKYFTGQLRMPLEVLIAFDDLGHAVGFAELSIRPYAEGCVTERVAYLEGWYVVPTARRQGVGRALVEAAERWAERQGCTEFGSDAVVDNFDSASAHAALGFDEIVRIRCFRKTIEQARPASSGIGDVQIREAAPDDVPKLREEISTQEGYPPGHRKFYLSKALD
jgi:aminoglycoside 6'-N-acetyltransferase I